ncbi:hypothetical protein K2173_017545 [Erythroxylum novogranatense]|uniref:AP2/ERF domain-containing protein n=1 Tax=Erythroxylum novogranatense TaxID=1862640 RepID=A0AAV8TKT8_9ROSI|nr:hypothetical protein K2173_017545 [Erythroxylum novogranatense]
MVKPGKSSPLSSPSSLSEQPTSDKTEPKYKGVRKRKWGKWVSEIRLPNSRERIWLGSYDTPEKAARAFDAALYCLRGGDAKFNFPGNPPDIADRQSLNPQEIQAVAARYANEEPATDGSGLEAHSSRGVLEHCTTSTSSSDGALQVDGDAALDWSFLNMLDSNNSVSEFGLYPWQDSMSGDYNYQPTDGEAGSSSQVVDENNREGDHTNEIHEGYSQSSFLWNF